VKLESKNTTKSLSKTHLKQSINADKYSQFYSSLQTFLDKLTIAKSKSQDEEKVYRKKRDLMKFEINDRKKDLRENKCTNSKSTKLWQEKNVLNVIQLK